MGITSSPPCSRRSIFATAFASPHGARSTFASRRRSVPPRATTSRRVPCARSPKRRRVQQSRAWRLDGLDLAPVAARVGSDVPFFISRAAYALVRGRGELVEALPAPEPFWIALVQLREEVSTAAVFAAHRAKRSKGERSATLAKALRDRKVTVDAIRENLHNDLLEAAQRVAPAIAEARNTASAMGIDLAMSGSGPSLFALGDDRAHAIAIARRLRRTGLRTRVLRLGVTP